MKDDVFCERDGKYSFRCKNNENCNLVIPLSETGWKMWETWELLKEAPQHEDKKQYGYNERSISELNAMMNARPMQEGFERRLGPIVLPLSLS